MRRISTATKQADKFGAGKHGFRDGDPVNAISATDLEAQFFDHVQEELCAVIESVGGTPDGSARDQVLTAIKTMIGAQSGNYALDTGAANAYVIALDPPIADYTDGLTVRFLAVNANTGAATLNAGGGPVPLLNNIGAELSAGDLLAGGLVTATYIAAISRFVVAGLVRSQVPSADKADKTAFASLLGANGYQKIHGGFIEQWGTINCPANTVVTVTLPITYPNACRNVQAIFKTDSLTILDAIAANTLSASQIKLANAADVAVDIMWRTIGD